MESPGYPNGPEERDALAGEYVLGTLTGAERQAFETRLKNDVALRAAVAGWSNRLQPLADSVSPATPSPDVRRRILGALSDKPLADKPLADKPRAGKVVPLPTSDTKRWTNWTIGLSALVAAAVVFIVIFAWPTAPDIGGYGTLLDKNGDTVLAFQVDHAHRELIVQGAMPKASAGRDYELWIIPKGGAPKSLGVVPATGRDERAIAAEIGPLMVDGATLAISLEPTGGSKTGAPTGPVLYTGPFEMADATN